LGNLAAATTVGIGHSIFTIRASCEPDLFQLTMELAASLPQAFRFRLESKHAVVACVL